MRDITKTKLNLQCSLHKKDLLLKTEEFLIPGICHVTEGQDVIMLQMLKSITTDAEFSDLENTLSKLPVDEPGFYFDLNDEYFMCPEDSDPGDIEKSCSRFWRVLID